MKGIGIAVCVGAFLVARPVYSQSADTPGQKETAAREGVAPTQAPVPLDSVVQIPLFSDWQWRQELAERGVTFTSHFIAEPAYVEHSYRGSGADYVQQLDWGAVFDLHKLGIGEGTVRTVFSDRVGRGLQQDYTGAYIQNQAFYGQGQNFRFDELSYERYFADQKVSLKGGFYSMGNDFAGLPYTCNFSNNGNCGHPLGLLYGSGWVDSPTGQWGGRLKWTDASGWYVESGIYDVTPQRKLKQNGLQVDFTGATGAIVPVELGYVRGKTPDDYAGTYKVGGYYDSSTVSDLAAQGRTAYGREGAYLQAAQQIWKPVAGSVRGIAIFGVATINDARTGLFRSTFEAGASWRGAIDGRGDDIASLGWVELNVDPRLRSQEQALGKMGQTDEQLWEVNYSVQVARWLLVRPTLQYVIRPGGYESRPRSCVFVLHVQASF